MVFARTNKDHRASASHAPRSIYGKIVAEADRDIDIDTVFTRAIQYGIEHDPDKDKEWQFKRFDSHMEEKYSNNGYIKLWIPHSPNEKKLKELRDIIVNKELLRQYFDKIYDKIIAG